MHLCREKGAVITVGNGIDAEDGDQDRDRVDGHSEISLFQFQPTSGNRQSLKTALILRRFQIMQCPNVAVPICAWSESLPANRDDGCGL
jgi:hypothetical protein